MDKSRLIKLAALAGMVAPILFAVVVTGLTIAQADFMRSLGWNPLGPVIDWPSGLAMGPYGWLMTVTFFIGGGMMAFFAYGLKLALQEKLATSLLMLAGFAMMCLVFTSDPTIGRTEYTWHGFLHDASFAVLGFTLMPGMLMLGWVFHRREQWKNLSIYTWATLALVIPTFWLKGLAFYVFLLAILVWSEVVAWRLKSPSD
ncbi:MAG TPA: DUF998 domain-containing protein [Anaerolineales bacterium]|nr:DUF998 domain-containing protein [Anaerolineales bacterium]